MRESRSQELYIPCQRLSTILPPLPLPLLPPTKSDGLAHRARWSSSRADTAALALSGQEEEKREYNSPGSPLSCLFRLLIALLPSPTGRKWYLNINPNFLISPGNQSPTLTSEHALVYAVFLREIEDDTHLDGRSHTQRRSLTMTVG